MIIGNLPATYITWKLLQELCIWPKKIGSILGRKDNQQAHQDLNHGIASLFEKKCFLLIVLSKDSF